MIVTTPTDLWIREALQSCKGSLAVSSPYVGGYFSTLTSRLAPSVSFTLLTRTLLTDFASGASDLEAVWKIAKRSGGILSLSSLHAKVYVIDGIRALVTSANATFSGMSRNRECGMEIRQSADVQQLSDLIQSGFGASPQPQRWTADELDKLREPVSTLRASLPNKVSLSHEAVEAPPKVELPRRQFDQLLKGLSGWLQLTLEGVSKIKEAVFSMQDVVDACAPLITARFPNNMHSREKLRQQMQRLRDLGLVLFLGNGRYERLAHRR